MSALRRSVTGCALCKARRKKCDESKPQCQRCLASGNNCVYEFIRYEGDQSLRVMRTKPGPRTTSNVSSRSSPMVLGVLPESESNSVLLPYVAGDLTIASYSDPYQTWGNSAYPAGLDGSKSWDVVNSQPQYLTTTSPSYTPRATHRNESSFTTLDILSRAGASRSCAKVPIAYGSTSRALTPLDVEDDEAGDHNAHDSEGIRGILCTVPTLDRNVQENSLPFVLQCYSNWIITKVFDPLKIAYTMRSQVIQHFSSENTRIRTILIANLMNTFARNLVIGHQEKSILNNLASAVARSSSQFNFAPPHFTPIGREQAMSILDSMLEVFTLQTSTLSTYACLQSLDHMAPIFRHACTEPPGQPINLPKILLNPNLNLRLFATFDIVANVTAGQPTYFRYEVPFSLELCEQVYQEQDTIGLQWLHGFPDQFILLFAWIISLSETPGANENSGLVTWIETIVPKIKIATSQSGDPLLRLRRVVVQECWRFAVLIYLYMAFCGVDAYDPRVVRAQKGFMRLVRGVSPGRNPDGFIFVPMTLAGVATVEERDRNTIRERFLNTRECAEPGTTGNDTLLMLEELWLRTRNEGRVAVWSDLGTARLAVVNR